MSGHERCMIMRIWRQRVFQDWGNAQKGDFPQALRSWNRLRLSGSASERSRPETAASDFEFVAARWCFYGRCGASCARASRGGLRLVVGRSD